MVNRAKTDTWVTLMGVVEVNWGKSLLPEHRQTPRLAKCSPALCRWKWPGAGWPCMELGFPPQLSAWHDSTVTGSPLPGGFAVGSEMCLPLLGAATRVALSEVSPRSSNPNPVCQIQKGAGDVSGGAENTECGLYI